MSANRWPYGFLLAMLIHTAAFAQDPIATLDQQIRGKQVRLEHDAKHGYLQSLLRNLNVPISSQTLVFSKTSLQSEHISPQTPRAMYFNDDVYVAWVQGASSIEIMSVDPKRGAMFYALGQENDGIPQFERVTGHVCSVCHFDEGSRQKFVPKLMMSSVIPDENGGVEGTFPLPTNDQSPFAERWGGWYVTGTAGTQKHLGNLFSETPRSPIGDLSKLDYSKSINVTDLTKRFDTSRYLSPHSDIVALMVLAHQIEVHNLLAIANAKPDAPPQETGEPLAKALLFEGAEALKEPVKGTSTFAEDFSSRGPLREFDLKTKLFRYPVSYMIYNKAFDALPETVKTYVYRRIVGSLNKSGRDGVAALDILRKTKPGFPSQ